MVVQEAPSRVRLPDNTDSPSIACLVMSTSQLPPDGVALDLESRVLAKPDTGKTGQGSSADPWLHTTELAQE
jgi:hypothetical protein